MKVSLYAKRWAIYFQAGRFYVDFGWVPGEAFRIAEISIGEYELDAFTILQVAILYLHLVLWVRVRGAD